MLELLRNWMNGSRDYNRGVFLFCILSDDSDLIAFFSKYSSDFAHRRLNEEMEKIYTNLTRPAKSEAEDVPPGPDPQPETPPAPAKNPELEEVCDQKAMQLYKQMMNDRAILFNLTKVEGWEDINKPDLVEQRRQLALQICATNYEVSQAYSDLAHVREFGRLPADDATDENTEVTDIRLNAEIANLRSSITKLRKRSQTPERVSLIQKHQEKLDGLIRRWNTIKQQDEN